MSKYNTKKEDNKVENYMGAPAYKLDDKLELVSVLLTSFAEDSYYEDASVTTDRVREKILALRDKRFAAKAAIFARNEFGMRSITHNVACEIAKEVKGENWTRPFFDKVVRRVDDITEILSCYMFQLYHLLH